MSDWKRIGNPLSRAFRAFRDEWLLAWREKQIEKLLKQARKAGLVASESTTSTAACSYMESRGYPGPDYSPYCHAPTDSEGHE